MLGLGGGRSIGLALDGVLLTWVSRALPQAAYVRQFLNDMAEG